MTLPFANCAQCGGDVYPVVGPGSIQDYRCEDCRVGGAELVDGRLTGPLFVDDLSDGLIRRPTNP